MININRSRLTLSLHLSLAIAETGLKMHGPLLQQRGLQISWWRGGTVPYI
jgi:hypothetical protein